MAKIYNWSTKTEKNLSSNEQGDSNVEDSIYDLQKSSTKDSGLNDTQSSGDSSTQIKENDSDKGMSIDKDIDKEKKDDVLKIKVKHEFKGKFKRR